MIAIVDYGVGNLCSVQKAFKFVGIDTVITKDKKVIDNCSHIVLPGVGAFSQAMELIKQEDFDKFLLGQIAKGKPFLGICLGMQMLFERSLEDGCFEGLGVFKGEIKRFDISLKVPHVGWNNIKVNSSSKILLGLDNNMFYFVHSYYAPQQQEFATSTCNYQIDFTASVEKDNVFATQFHPEKSGEVGLQILKNFGGLK
ncbi:MAG: imidazole glycerol phosphate synthase subunit HisH [Clostridia bacterium]